MRMTQFWMEESKSYFANCFQTKCRTTCDRSGQVSIKSWFDDIKSWIDNNDKRVRFVVWAALAIWAAIATIVANIPPDTHPVTTTRDYPPQTEAPMSLSCQGHELAESWSISSSKPAESA